jgi:hypothetical protein
LIIIEGGSELKVIENAEPGHQIINAEDLQSFLHSTSWTIRQMGAADATPVPRNAVIVLVAHAIQVPSSLLEHTLFINLADR